MYFYMMKAVILLVSVFFSVLVAQWVYIMKSLLDILQELVQFACVYVIILLVFDNKSPLCNSALRANMCNLTSRDYLALDRAAP